MRKDLYMGCVFSLLITLGFLSGPAGAKTQDEIINIKVYRKASPGVLNIASVVVAYDFFYRPIPKEGTGSGTVVDQLGHIVTNNRVIQNSKSLELTLYDESKLPAVLVGTDPAYYLGLNAERGAMIMEVVPNGPADRAGLKGGNRQVQIGNSLILSAGMWIQSSIIKKPIPQTT